MRLILKTHPNPNPDNLCSLRDSADHEVQAQSEAPLAPSTNRPMAESDVVRALGITLGGAADNTLVLASTNFSGLRLEQGGWGRGLV